MLARRAEAVDAALEAGDAADRELLAAGEDAAHGPLADRGVGRDGGALGDRDHRRERPAVTAAGEEGADRALAERERADAEPLLREGEAGRRRVLLAHREETRAGA